MKSRSWTAKDSRPISHRQCRFARVRYRCDHRRRANPSITRANNLFSVCFQQNRSAPRKPLFILKSNELLTSQDAAGGNRAGPSAEGINLNNIGSTLGGGGSRLWAALTYSYCHSLRRVGIAIPRRSPVYFWVTFCIFR